MPATCEDRLAACEEVLEAADRAIKNQGELISKQSEQIQDLKFNYNIVKAQLNEQIAETNAWYRNSAIIIPLSFVAGAVVMSQVSK